MAADQELAHKRLTLLQLAEKLGNVSEACRMHKVSRSQFYEYKCTFQTHGIDGLADTPPIPASHPKQCIGDVHCYATVPKSAQDTISRRRIRCYPQWDSIACKKGAALIHWKSNATMCVPNSSRTESPRVGSSILSLGTCKIKGLRSIP
jgi:hypothetical protein